GGEGSLEHRRTVQHDTRRDKRGAVHARGPRHDPRRISVGLEGGADRIRADQRIEGQDYRCRAARGPRSPRSRPDNAHYPKSHVHRISRSPANSTGAGPEDHYTGSQRLPMCGHERDYSEARQDRRSGPERKPCLSRRRYSNSRELRLVRSDEEPDTRPGLLGIRIRPLVAGPTIAPSECSRRDKETQGTLPRAAKSLRLRRVKDKV